MRRTQTSKKGFSAAEKELINLIVGSMKTSCVIFAIGSEKEYIIAGCNATKY